LFTIHKHIVLSL